MDVEGGARNALHVEGESYADRSEVQESSDRRYVCVAGRKGGWRWIRDCEWKDRESSSERTCDASASTGDQRRYGSCEGRLAVVRMCGKRSWLVASIGATRSKDERGPLSLPASTNPTDEMRFAF